MRLQSCSHQFSPRRSRFVEIWPFSLLIRHFTVSGILFEFDSSDVISVDLQQRYASILRQHTGDKSTPPCRCKEPRMPWSYKKQRQVDSNSLLRISCRRSRSKVPLLFSHACYLAHLSTNLYSKGGLCSAKKWSCEVVGGHQFSKKRFSFVLGKIWLLWLLIWHFMASGHCMASGMFFKFGTSHHVAAGLLVLRAALMPLVKVPWCHNCSSKLCLQVGTCETRSPQLMQLCPNYKFGTASFQLPSSTTSTTATRYRACAGKKSEAAKL